MVYSCGRNDSLIGRSIVFSIVFEVISYRSVCALSVRIPDRMISEFSQIVPKQHRLEALRKVLMKGSFATLYVSMRSETDCHELRRV